MHLNGEFFIDIIDLNDNLKGINQPATSLKLISEEQAHSKSYFSI